MPCSRCTTGSPTCNSVRLRMICSGSRTRPLRWRRSCTWWPNTSLSVTSRDRARQAVIERGDADAGVGRRRGGKAAKPSASRGRTPARLEELPEHLAPAGGIGDEQGAGRAARQESRSARAGSAARGLASTEGNARTAKVTAVAAGPVELDAAVAVQRRGELVLGAGRAAGWQDRALDVVPQALVAAGHVVQITDSAWSMAPSSMNSGAGRQVVEHGGGRSKKNGR
jgi:hypothetical protein